MFMKKVFLLLFVCSGSLWAQRFQPVKYVDPFIGTGGHGHTYPGATVPFGMVQLSPDNGTQGWDWCSGYHYSDSMIVGFSHTHLSGTGIGDLLDVSVMPMTNVNPDTLAYRSKFSHQQEQAAPGYYQVWLQDSKINAELTTTKRVGFHRYTFPASHASAIKIDLGWAINWDKATDCAIRQISSTTFAGYRKSTGWAKNQVVYFAVELSKPVQQLSLFANQLPVAGQTAQAQKVLAFLQFATAANEQVLMKVALSTASEAGALAGLQEVNHWSFEKVKQAATQTWNQALSAIEVQSADPAFLRTFYTALYHTYLAPVLNTDALGQYKGADHKNYESKQPVYSVHSLWDTFRGANPLFTITQPDRVGDIIHSYLLFYQQSGLLPVWDLHFNETNTMTGYHAIPIIADAMLKNIKGFDYELAYTAMKASAMQNTRGTPYYRQFGFVPQNKHGWSVTMTLEYAYDDWCIAQVAKKMGKAADAKMFMERSQFFRNLYDPKTGFFRAKNDDGKWVEPFDPYHSEHGFDGMYIEGTAWQHTFFVPHAVADYAAMLGGKAKLEEKLDSLFTTTSQMNGDNVSTDITGLIGQYAHGNEPSHHIAYMYTVLGKPYKTAERVRQIMTTMYGDTPDGLVGNEDCGQMSAWYVWSALGMYPMNASAGEYVLGSPLVDKAVIRLPQGKKFVISVSRQSKKSVYIKSATLNGKPIAVKWLTHASLIKGGTLELALADTP
jgi:predicted alpha-1,2-mannosidase